MAICSAIDGSLVKCVPLGGDGVSAQPSVKPPSDEGIGHNQHSFEVWLAAGEEAQTDHQHHHHYHIHICGTR